MKGLSDQEIVLLERWKAGDERSLKALLEPYLDKIFAFALHLNAGDEERAYQVTISAFVEILSVPSRKEKFLPALARKTLTQSRKFQNPPPGKSSGGLKSALLSLDFETRALLLLRDHTSLTYEEISRLLQISKKSVRIKIIQARELLKEKIRGFAHA